MFVLREHLEHFEVGGDIDEDSEGILCYWLSLHQPWVFYVTGQRGEPTYRIVFYEKLEISCWGELGGFEDSRLALGIGYQTFCRF